VRAEDFQWLGDKMGEFFPDGERERGLDLLAQAQEHLEELETALQFLRENPDLPFK
jgi:hypothetical protein